MKGKIDNPTNAKIIDEFLALYQEFHESTCRTTCKKVLSFLKNRSKMREFIEYARFDPHPNVYQEIENDIEAAITSLESWLHDRVNPDVPAEFLEDLRAWVIQEE